jgi:HlyD family secretion protein
MKLKITRVRKLIMSLVILAGASALAVEIARGRRFKASDYLTADIQRGVIRQTVSATGALQAVTTVQVGSQVSGTIQSLSADFNSVVKKDQIIAQLDPAIFQAQVEQAAANLIQARADLAAAQAKFLAAQSEVDNQRAAVSGADANLAALKAQRDDAKSFYDRQQTLANENVVAQRDLEAARNSYEEAEARYDQAAAQVNQAQAEEKSAAVAGLDAARAQVKEAQAQERQNAAALELAKVNLSHTAIRSPIDGVVISRNVDVGQTVAASLQAPTIFVIANDLTRMQVIASIDQADVGVINASNRVSFTVDAYPADTFSGRISQIRLDAQNVQNVVTYNAVIEVDNYALKLKPGMTANLTFTIAKRANVLRAPNAALRFTPSGVTPGEPGQSFATPTAAVLPGQSRVVWVLGPDHRPQTRRITIGITDGVNTEVTEGDLKEGESVILGRT